jgi:hypothetical protein
MKYKIFDWAGNDLTSHFGTFSDFQSAWEAIHDYVSDQTQDENEFEEMCGEYQVLSKA